MRVYNIKKYNRMQKCSRLKIFDKFPKEDWTGRMNIVNKDYVRDRQQVAVKQQFGCQLRYKKEEEVVRFPVFIVYATGTSALYQKYENYTNI